MKITYPECGSVDIGNSCVFVLSKSGKLEIFTEGGYANMSGYPFRFAKIFEDVLIDRNNRFDLE